MSDYTFPLVAGLGVVCFLAMYLMTVLDEEKHLILRLLLLFFVVSMMLLIPKATIDGATQCDVVINSTTTTGATTDYTYTSYCYNRLENTSLSFLKNTQRLYYIIIGYSIVYLAVWAMMKLRDSINRGKTS